MFWDLPVVFLLLISRAHYGQRIYSYDFNTFKFVLWPRYGLFWWVVYGCLKKKRVFGCFLVKLIRSFWLIVFFRTFKSLLIFCLVFLWVSENEVLKFPIITENLSISPFSSYQFFMYFVWRVPFRIVMYSCWTHPLSLYNVPLFSLAIVFALNSIQNWYSHSCFYFVYMHLFHLLSELIINSL